MPGTALQTRWIRHAIIRGDGAAGGVILMVTGAGALSWGLVSAQSLLGLSGAIWMVAGAGLMRWSRARYRDLIAEVVAAHAGHDPGDSPVPWVSGDVWRLKNRFDPELDAANELLSEVDPLRSPFAERPGEALRGVQLRPVSDNERSLVSVPETTSSLRETPEGSAAELLELLGTTPGRQLAVSLRWPVCCRRLTVLVSLSEADHPELAAHLTSEEPGEAWDVEATSGQHGFSCSACGRSYTTDPSW